MFAKRNTSTSITKMVENIDQEILDHKLNIIEINGRIRTLQEKKELLMSLNIHEVICTGVEVQKQEIPAA
jgi:hypothetical protein